MTISQEAIELFDEAGELVSNAGDSLTSADLRDAISLLLVAIEKSKGNFADAHALLAELYRGLGDRGSASRHADMALSQNPELLETQWLKVRLALEDPGSMNGGLVGAISGMSKKRQLKDAIERYMVLYGQLCERGMEADLFVYRSNAMIKLADDLVRMRNPFGKVLYGRVANAPIAKLIFEEANEQDEVQRVLHLAQGRMAL